MLIEACLKQMTTGCYQAQSPRIHSQFWHLKHLVFILWRRWDNPLGERHKHSTLGTWLLAQSPIQPTSPQQTVCFSYSERWNIGKDKTKGHETIFRDFEHHHTATRWLRTHTRQKTLSWARSVHQLIYTVCKLNLAARDGKLSPI